MRKRDRVKLFWEHVAQALGLEDAQIRKRRRLSTAHGDLVAHLFGALRGIAFEAGVHHPGGEFDQAFTYVAVIVDGLPPGLTVGRWKTKQTGGLVGPRRSWIDCDGGGGKEVRASAGKKTRIDVGGLIVEQEAEGFDLESFLTPRRRQVICSLDGEIVMEGEGDHKLWTRITELPYPRRREMIRATQGDIEATQTLLASRDRVVELIRTAVREAELVGRELGVDHTP